MGEPKRSRAMVPEEKAARAITRALDGLSDVERSKALDAAIGADDLVVRLARAEVALAAISEVVLPSGYANCGLVKRIAHLGLDRGREVLADAC